MRPLRVWKNVFPVTGWGPMLRLLAFMLLIRPVGVTWAAPAATAPPAQARSPEKASRYMRSKRAVKCRKKGGS